MDKAFEMDQIRRAREAIMKRFGMFVFGCGDDWPKCYLHQTPMCQVIKKDSNTYYICLEFDDEGKCCGHKEWSV